MSDTRAHPAPSLDADIVIVGAGPIGLAAAIEASLRGLFPVVIDARTVPIDKACGEGVMPHGLTLLRSLGVEIDDARSMLFDGIRYVQNGRHVEARFPDGPGMGIRRIALSEALVRRARALAGPVRTGCRFHGFTEHQSFVEVDTSLGRLTARWLVGADGLHSPVRRAMGIEPAPTRRRRFGVRRHFRVHPWSSMVEVHWHPEIEAYVTPISPDEVGIALLWNGDGRRFDDLLGSFPMLRERLDGADAVSDAKGAGPFLHLLPRRSSGRVALVGDAAGYIDPLTGEGITLGLATARALVDTIVTGGSMEEYERAYHRLSRRYYLLTRGILRLTAVPQIRRRLVPFLSHVPRLFETLVGLNAAPASRKHALENATRTTRSAMSRENLLPHNMTARRCDRRTPYYSDDHGRVPPQVF